MSSSGYFASVIFASAEGLFDPKVAKDGDFFPLDREHGVYQKYSGLTAI